MFVHGLGIKGILQIPRNSVEGKGVDDRLQGFQGLGKSGLTVGGGGWAIKCYCRIYAKRANFKF